MKDIRGLILAINYKTFHSQELHLSLLSPPMDYCTVYERRRVCE